MQSGGLVFKGLFFVVFVFGLVFGIMKGEPEKFTVLFNISLGFWGVAAFFLTMLLIAKEKVMPMLIEGYKQSFDDEQAKKQIKKASITLIVNIIGLSVLAILFFLNQWLVSAGIIAVFLTLYSVFVSQFLGELRKEYELK
jgi:drug/metabolite transporter (DMT)-like permease